MAISCWSLERSAVAAELKRFVAEKCAQVRAEARAPGHDMVPESRALFAAAEKADWPGVFESIAAMHKAMREGWKHPRTVGVVYPVEWAVVNEIGAALEAFAAWEKYAIAFARDIIASVPQGSIYFGGTEPGRFLVTTLSASHVKGEPFFTLTQNALADQRSYLRYVRGMYGRQIYIPTDEDVTKAIKDYQQDAQRRRKEGKLLPGEFVEEAEGKTEFRGQLSVMAVNGALSRLLFEKNPGREFYVEESFPLDWMYPHLTPHGLILKINREPAVELSPNVVQQDQQYWLEYLSPIIGDWLQVETSLEEVVAFVEQVHLSPDTSGFSVDRQFVENDYAQKAFSKLRCSIGGVYAWRAHHTDSPVEKETMSRAAEFAFRQAFALASGSPEAVFRYVNLLLSQKRIDDALRLAEAATKLEKVRDQAQDGARIQEGCTNKPISESQEGSLKVTTQVSSLLQTLRRLKNR